VYLSSAQGRAVRIYFEVVGEIEKTSTIAVRSGIHQLDLLREQYGEGRWMKLKGVGLVRLPDGTLRWAELHWYEAHGIGRRRMKIKRFLD
jgi:hypothetical protein